MLKVIILLIILLNACSPVREKEDHESHVSLPVAFINFDNQYISFSEKSGALVATSTFDSTCVFRLYSLNNEMKAIIEFPGGSYFGYDFDSNQMMKTDFKKALPLNLEDLEHSYLAFTDEKSAFLSIDSGGVYFSPEKSYRNIFYGVYNPADRIDKYKKRTRIKQYFNDFMKIADNSELQQKAAKNNLSVKDQALLDAIWLFRNKHQFDFKDTRVLHYFKKVNSNKSMKKLMIEKARERNISVYRMTWLDAVYFFKKEMKHDYDHLIHK